jgi:signal transduction histidine kinase
MVALLAVGSFIAGLSQRFAHMNILSDTDAPSSWTPEAFQSALTQLGLSIGAYHSYRLALDLTFALCFFTVAAVLLWRNANDWMALFAALALLSFGALWPTNTDELARVYPAWAWLFSVEDQLALTFLLVFLCLYPTGRFVPRWLGWLLIIWVVSGIVGLFTPSPPNELNVLLLLGFLGAALAAQVYRYQRRSDAIQRQQIKWLVFGFSVTLASVVALLAFGAIFPSLEQPGTAGVLYEAAGAAIGTVLFLPIPLCVGVALLRYHLWDIDILINRTLVYGALTASVVGVYILVVGYLGALFRTGGNLLISLIATGVVALLFQPLRGWLQRGVNRLTYGQRDEPYLVVAQLGRRLESTLAPEAMLPAITETVAQALKLPYAAIALKRDGELHTEAVYGTPMEAALTLSLVYQAETIGQLTLGPRQRGETFTPADRRLLEDLARQIGVAAHAVQLTDDLQRSRERLVTAREEERRRLRRDLHDGLGSALTSLMLKLDATDTLLDRDVPAARSLLAETRGQMQASITDIRRLVYDLRPPTLDEWGLVDALREQVAHSAVDDVRVTIEAPESLPPLSAAVEVAVYRIALEALANVVKHAHATSCAIRLSLVKNTLVVEIEDDGVGRPVGTHAGVGMTAMRERAAELGGSCAVDGASPQGTRVRASIPLASQ